jgi:hypothetical protein
MAQLEGDNLSNFRIAMRDTLQEMFLLESLIPLADEAEAEKLKQARRIIQDIRDNIDPLPY